MATIENIKKEHQLLSGDGENSEGTMETSAETRETLMELSEVAAAQSMLVYLMYGMRTLSATGRIATKYEYLNIDSDKVSRGRASDLAGGCTHDFESHGVTGAHIIGIFLLEVIREAEKLNENEGESGCDPSQHSQEFLTGKKYREAACGMHVLLRYLKGFYETDLAPGLPKVNKQEYPLNLPSKKEGNATSANAMRKSTFRQQVAMDSEWEGHHLRLRPPSFMLRSSWVTDAELMNSTRDDNYQWLGHEIDDIIDINNRFAGSSTTADTDTSTQYHSKRDMKLLLEEAIASRDAKRLGFLKHFFQEGSFMRLLVESPAEIVWLHDWHPMNELTYCIAVDRDKKRVILSFQQMVSKSDQNHAFDRSFLSTENPIAEAYPGRSKNLKLHRGFYKYLFRARRDTGTTKYDEICAKLAHYCAQFGDEARILVTGHSMGGAMATVMSFYVSTDDRFTTIEAVTTGAPRVGGYVFADAVRHQESMGKLRIARFHCEQDPIPLMPPSSFSFSKRGAIYHSNGIDVNLPPIGKGLFKFCLSQRQPTVTYLGRESPLQSYRRQLREFGSLFRIRYGMHYLYEHKNRIALAQKDPGNSPLARFSLEELYEMWEVLE